MSKRLEMRAMNKWFNGVHALQDIDFDLSAGEVVAIVGDNGAGKSTLIKILAGLHQPDSGTLEIDGKTIDFSHYDVAMARKLGVETVYQERSLGEKQPLWRNLFVGRHLCNRFGFIRVQEEKRITQQLLQDIGLRGIGITPESDVSILSGGERQGLAIGRAMYFDANIIILDEPTNALSLHEVGKVLSFIRHIKESGRSCILICHNMAHVYDVADRFVFVDRGRIVAEHDRSEISLEQLSTTLINIARTQTAHAETGRANGGPL